MGPNRLRANLPAHAGRALPAHRARLRRLLHLTTPRRRRPLLELRRAADGSNFDWRGRERGGGWDEGGQGPTRLVRGADRGVRLFAAASESGATAAVSGTRAADD
jgi:hypothetical protein